MRHVRFAARLWRRYGPSPAVVALTLSGAAAIGLWTINLWHFR